MSDHNYRNNDESGKAFESDYKDILERNLDSMDYFADDPIAMREFILKEMGDGFLTSNLTSGEGLSEEFKTKAATIFEAALKSKIRIELERLEEEYAEAYDSAISEAKDELTTKVDGYLTYVVEEWMKKNSMS